MTPVQIALRMQCAAAWPNANVQAFFAVVRHGEGTSDPDGYRRHFGGELITNFADHPRRVVVKTMAGKTYRSSACGVAQFIEGTWDDCVAALGLTDFSPESQNLAFVRLLHYRKALGPILEGQFERAIDLCNEEWASLPGSPYGQPVMTMAKALEIYNKAGGLHGPVSRAEEVTHALPDDKAEDEKRPADSPVNIPQVPSTPRPIPAEEAVNMSPFLPIALDAIFSVVPKLAKEFGSGSEVANRNIRAAEAIVETAKSAIGAVNEQQIVEKLSTDKEAASLVSSAIQEKYFELTEIGGGIKAAAERNAIYSVPGAPPFWHNPAFTVSAGFVLMLWAILVDMLFIHPESYSDDGLRTQIVTGVLALISGVAGYWLGTIAKPAEATRRITDAPLK